MSKTNTFVQLIAPYGSFDLVGNGRECRKVRHGEVKITANDPRQRDKVRRLLRSGKIIWRFPWPNEDGRLGHGYIANRPDRALTFPWDGWGDSTIEHTWLYDRVTAAGLSRQWTVKRPCPIIDPAAEGLPKLLRVYGQLHPRGSKPVTVFACGYCDAIFTLSHEAVTAIRKMPFGALDVDGDTRREWIVECRKRLQGTASPAQLRSPYKIESAKKRSRSSAA